jgi:hypothetical protein
MSLTPENEDILRELREQLGLDDGDVVGDDGVEGPLVDNELRSIISGADGWPELEEVQRRVQRRRRRR